MRPVIQIVLQDVDGLRFMVANYFDERGQPADLILKPQKYNFDVRRTVMEIMSAHNAQSVDIFTDSEELFKMFLSSAGVNVHYSTESEMRPLYENLNPDSFLYSTIREVWFPDVPKTEYGQAIEVQPDTLWLRLKQKIKEAIKWFTGHLKRNSTNRT